ncbi:hypothetical protein [Cellulomonas massiliensis]|uniref:hypothetical protein n=1 Tax=Cellulomonas massiliensis TaxID=1465811 RepID=UPI0002DEFE2E|nr:hypothetical protein [Cellulomonas massiliensis]
MDVYLVHHIHHAAFLDGSPTVHRGDDGELVWDEEDGDDLKMLGVFSSDAAAARAVDHARTLPGFRDEPDCFLVTPHTVDTAMWAEGYVSDPD